jgi:hypothetical protein
MTAVRVAKLATSTMALALLLSACPADEPGGTDGRDGGSDAATAGCDGIPQCGFACPAGTVNPRDRSGCEHTCTCVLAEYASEGPVVLKMYGTCGDPVCGGPRGNSGAPVCASGEVEGAACRIEGARCDLQNQCNQLLICARKDPKTQVGGCPIAAAPVDR